MASGSENGDSPQGLRDAVDLAREMLALGVTRFEHNGLKVEFANEAVAHAIADGRPKAILDAEAVSRKREESRLEKERRKLNRELRSV